MEAIGVTVFRRALSDVKHTIHHENVAAMKADMAQMKAEQAKAHADRKAKLQEKINQLDSKIQTQLQKAKERREAGGRIVGLVTRSDVGAIPRELWSKITVSAAMHPLQEMHTVTPNTSVLDAGAPQQR